MMATLEHVVSWPLMVQPITTCFTLSLQYSSPSLDEAPPAPPLHSALCLILSPWVLPIDDRSSSSCLFGINPIFKKDVFI